MRQKDDQLYADILGEVRLGNLSENHVAILQSRVVVDSSTKKPILINPSEIGDYLVDLMKKEPETLCLVPTVDLMNAINERCLDRLGLKKVEIPSYDQQCKGMRRGKSHYSGKKV